MFTRMNEAFKTRLIRGKESDKGFTLIELLVVVLIIGILSAIAIPIFLNQQANAKDKATMAQITNAKTAVASELVNGTPPGFDMGAVTDFTESADIPVKIVWSGAGDTLAFCISGSDITTTAHLAAIDDKGAAIEGGTCSTAAVATPPAAG